MTVQFDWHAKAGPTSGEGAADGGRSKASHPASFSGISWTATGWPRPPSPSPGSPCRCRSPGGGCSSCHLDRGEEAEGWEDRGTCVYCGFFFFFFPFFKFLDHNQRTICSRRTHSQQIVDVPQVAQMAHLTANGWWCIIFIPAPYNTVCSPNAWISAAVPPDYSAPQAVRRLNSSSTLHCRKQFCFSPLFFLLFCSIRGINKVFIYNPGVLKGQ